MSSAFREVYAASRFATLSQDELYSKAFQVSVRRLPVNLFLIRHGYSWGNLATYYMKKRKLDEIPPEVFEFVTKKPGWLYPLTTFESGEAMPPGTEQAYSVSAWFKDAFPFPLHRVYYSTHVRAAQSMYLGTHGLGIPDRRIYRDSQQCERNWGIFDRFNPTKEVIEEYYRFRELRDLDPLNATPPHGENLASVIHRTTGKMMPRLYRKCTDQNVALFCHGEVVWSYRYHLEGMTPEFYLTLHHSESKMADESVHNSQIIWYTRLDPFTGEEHDRFRWVKFVVPWAREFNVDWQPVDPGQHVRNALSHLAQTVKIPERQLYLPEDAVAEPSSP